MAPSSPFTQEDPIGIAGGLNTYGYANGDPVNFSDPFGLCPTDDGAALDCVIPIDGLTVTRTRSCGGFSECWRVLKESIVFAADRWTGGNYRACGVERE